MNTFGQIAPDLAASPPAQLALGMNPPVAAPPVKLALVTGTSSGIGTAVARLLLEGSWTVVGVARRAAQLDHPRYRTSPWTSPT